MIIDTELTINNASEIYKSFAEAIETENEIQIQIKNQSPIDVTFVQILHAFQKKCNSLNKNVTLKVKDENSFINSLEQMGYFELNDILTISAANGKEE
jgi:ABC-type transporter Mla MlaB component